jgi:hypothetical protein
MASRVRGGFVGPVAFDANGDPNPSPITIYRIDATAPQRSHRGPPGAVPEGTYVPPASLVR